MNFLLCFLSSISLTAINPVVVISEITTYSHNNMNENDYFNNEVEELIFKYVDSTLKNKTTNHTHHIVIDPNTMAFLDPLSSHLSGSSEIYHSRAFLENNLNVEQTLYTEEREKTVSKTNELSTTTAISAEATVKFNFADTTLSMSFSETRKHSETIEEKRTFKAQLVNVPAKTKVIVNYSIIKEWYSKEYNLMIPVKNNEPFKVYSWRSSGWTPATVNRIITPSEAYRAIHNDKSLLEYYFGKNEFYQYKDFIGHEWDTDYFWAVVPVKTYEEVNNLHLTILPDEN